MQTSNIFFEDSKVVGNMISPFGPVMELVHSFSS